MITPQSVAGKLDWLALTDAIAQGHNGPRADVADVFLYEGRTRC